MIRVVVSVLASVWFLYTSYMAYHWVGLFIGIAIMLVPLCFDLAMDVLNRRRALRSLRETHERLKKLLEQQQSRTEARIDDWFNNQQGDNSDDGTDTKLQEFVSSRPRIKSRRMGHRLQDGQDTPDKSTVQ